MRPIGCCAVLLAYLRDRVCVCRDYCVILTWKGMALAPVPHVTACACVLNGCMSVMCACCPKAFHDLVEGWC
jgi:hypothetical protein